MDIQKLQSIIESLLFVSGEPLKISRLAKICAVSKNEAEAALAGLEEDYKTGRGLEIITKDELVQLATNSENAEFVSQLVSGELSAEPSKSALETLSIVAYKGPLTRLQIEAIRGVNCTYALRSLQLKGLIERKESVSARGYEYEISFEFLKCLGISKASDLPDWQELSNNDKVKQLLEDPTITEDSLTAPPS